MSTYARIAGGFVAELFTPPADVPITACFHPALTWVDVTGVSPVPQVGWTATQTAGVWSFAAPVAAVPTLAQQAGAAIGAGLTITLSGTVTLAATLFPTDPTTQTKLLSITTGINTTGTFPGGATSYKMRDSAGAWHVLTVSQYKQVAAAIRDYVAPLVLIIDGNPDGAVALPAASVSLTV